jgi:hypothetical protein
VESVSKSDSGDDMSCADEAGVESELEDAGYCAVTSDADDGEELAASGLV